MKNDKGPDTKVDIVKKAIWFAGEKHKGQVRKFAKTPYIFHPFSVVKILVEVTGDPAVLAAGLLHDTLEDTQTTYVELVGEFGEEVAKLVDAVTEQDKSLVWEARKLKAVEHLREGNEKSWLIKAADMTDNLTSLNRLLQEHGTKEVMKCFGAPLSAQLKMSLKFYGALQELWSANPLLSNLAAEIKKLANFVPPCHC